MVTVDVRAAIVAVRLKCPRACMCLCHEGLGNDGGQVAVAEHGTRPDGNTLPCPGKLQPRCETKIGSKVKLAWRGRRPMSGLS